MDTVHLARRGRLVQRKELVMPNLQLDLPGKYPLAVKRNLAKRFGDLYAAIMETTPDLVDVTFRELGEGNLWRCGEQGPVPAATLICDIRRGRSPAQRERLAKALLDACVAALGLDPLLISVEFTQHSGDEIYRTILIDGVPQGGLSKDWSATETETPLVDAIRAEHHAG
jgi:phenylpyruvate tautomerase PptA (4-oxalocrotonate tautomerase family)